jgi:glycosyltransferase involved in cell wall biosynthesis
MKVYPQLLKPLTKASVMPYIECMNNFISQHQEILITVIIVAYDTNQDLIYCLDSLKMQTKDNFEIIVVDNGKNEAVLEELANYPVTYIRLKNNYKPSLARNIGIVHANGELICFLDDDALAHSEFVEQHLMAHKSKHVLGVRGKILPKTNSIYNSLAYHYDLCDDVIPSYIDVEGNASFRKDLLIEVGGFNQENFSGEGVELSYRIAQQFGAPTDLIYWPRAIVYHDFSNSVKKYIRKTIRGAKMSVRLEKNNPDLYRFIESYAPLPSKITTHRQNMIGRLYLALLRRVGFCLKLYGIKWFRWKFNKGCSRDN